MSQKCQHARDLWSQLDALRLGMNYSKEDVNKLQVLVDDCYGEVIRAVSILTNWAMKPCWVFMKRRSRGPSPCNGYLRRLGSGPRWDELHPGISRSYCQHGRNSCLSGAL